MIPVMQSNISTHGGDCFAACVASILESPLTLVPKPSVRETQHYDAFWYYVRKVNRHFLKKRGLYCAWLPALNLNDREVYFPEGLHVAVVQVEAMTLDGNRAGTAAHCVVGQGKKVIHNPSPVQCRIVGYLGFYLLLPIDPNTVRVIDR